MVDFLHVFAVQAELAVPIAQTALAFYARSVDYISAGQQVRCQPAQQLGREPCADAEANLCNQEHQEYEVHDVSSLWAPRSTVNGQEVGVLEWRVMVPRELESVSPLTVPRQRLAAHSKIESQGKLPDAISAISADCTVLRYTKGAG